MATPIFQFSKQQRNGIIIVVLLLLTIIITWQVVKYYYQPKQAVHETAAFKEIPNNFSQIEEDNIESQNTASSYHNYANNYSSDRDDNLKHIAYNPQPFNPNNASIESMIQSGVPIGSAKRIIKYRNKGGVFYEKEKLKNFGFTEADYEKVAPYIQITEQRKSYAANKYTNNAGNNALSYNTYTPKVEPTNLDINAATQEELMQFKGIGTGYSKRIIEYREKLGGFLSVDQVKEVYGLPDSTFLHIKDKLIIGNKNIQRININTATLEVLASHPYIRKYMAEHIIKFRNDIGKFNSIQELRQIPLINEEKYRKIVPYIYIE